VLHTRALVLATGARYRRLEVEHLETFEGSNIHYWAWPLEGRLCSGQEVVVVGGGNSAGQATVYVASVASKVWTAAPQQGLACPDVELSRQPHPFFG
jgi:thioredoxin reductase (NADPH)